MDSTGEEVVSSTINDDEILKIKQEEKTNQENELPNLVDSSSVVESKRSADQDNSKVLIKSNTPDGTYVVSTSNIDPDNVTQLNLNLQIKVDLEKSKKSENVAISSSTSFENEENLGFGKRTVKRKVWADDMIYDDLTLKHCTSPAPQKKPKGMKMTPPRGGIRPDCPPFCRNNCTLIHHVLLSAARKVIENDSRTTTVFIEKVENYYKENDMSASSIIHDNWKDTDFPLLHYLALMGKCACTFALSQSGHNPTTTVTTSNDTVLHTLVRHMYLFNCTHGHMHLLQKKFRLMLQEFVDCLKFVNRTKETPVILVARCLSETVPLLSQTGGGHKPFRLYQFQKDMLTMCVNQLQFVDSAQELINLQDDKGNTAAHYVALDRASSNILDILRDQGADFSRLNNLGKSVETVIFSAPAAPPDEVLDMAVSSSKAKKKNSTSKKKLIENPTPKKPKSKKNNIESSSTMLIDDVQSVNLSNTPVTPKMKPDNLRVPISLQRHLSNSASGPRIKNTPLKDNSKLNAELLNSVLAPFSRIEQTNEEENVDIDETSSVNTSKKDKENKKDQDLFTKMINEKLSDKSWKSIEERVQIAKHLPSSQNLTLKTTTATTANSANSALLIKKATGTKIAIPLNAKVDTNIILNSAAPRATFLSSNSVHVQQQANMPGTVYVRSPNDKTTSLNLVALNPRLRPPHTSVLGRPRGPVNFCPPLMAQSVQNQQQSLNVIQNPINRHHIATSTQHIAPNPQQLRTIPQQPRMLRPKLSMPVQAGQPHPFVIMAPNGMRYLVPNNGSAPFPMSTQKMPGVQTWVTNQQSTTPIVLSPSMVATSKASTSNPTTAKKSFPSSPIINMQILCSNASTKQPSTRPTAAKSLEASISNILKRGRPTKLQEVTPPPVIILDESEDNASVKIEPLDITKPETLPSFTGPDGSKSNSQAEARNEIANQLSKTQTVITKFEVEIQLNEMEVKSLKSRIEKQEAELKFMRSKLERTRTTIVLAENKKREALEESCVLKHRLISLETSYSLNG